MESCAVPTLCSGDHVAPASRLEIAPTLPTWAEQSVVAPSQATAAVRPSIPAWSEVTLRFSVGKVVVLHV
jgi:hypothetical protein